MNNYVNSLLDLHAKWGKSGYSLTDIVDVHDKIRSKDPFKCVSQFDVASVVETQNDLEYTMDDIKFLFVNDHKFDGDLNHFSMLKNVEDISIDGSHISTPISDLTALATYSNLKSLKLRDNAIKDISPLTEIKGLEYLNLYNNPVEDWRPLIQIPSLNKIKVETIPQDIIEEVLITNPNCVLRYVDDELDMELQAFNIFGHQVKSSGYSSGERFVVMILFVNQTKVPLELDEVIKHPEVKKQALDCYSISMNECVIEKDLVQLIYNRIE